MPSKHAVIGWSRCWEPDCRFPERFLSIGAIIHQAWGNHQRCPTSRALGRPLARGRWLVGLLVASVAVPSNDISESGHTLDCRRFLGRRRDLDRTCLELEVAH